MLRMAAEKDEPPQVVRITRLSGIESVKLARELNCAHRSM